MKGTTDGRIELLGIARGSRGDYMVRFRDERGGFIKESIAILHGLDGLPCARGRATNFCGRFRLVEQPGSCTRGGGVVYDGYPVQREPFEGWLVFEQRSHQIVERVKGKVNFLNQLENVEVIERHELGERERTECVINHALELGKSKASTRVFEVINNRRITERQVLKDGVIVWEQTDSYPVAAPESLGAAQSFAVTELAFKPKPYMVARDSASVTIVAHYTDRYGNAQTVESDRTLRTIPNVGFRSFIDRQLPPCQCGEWRRQSLVAPICTKCQRKAKIREEKQPQIARRAREMGNQNLAKAHGEKVRVATATAITSATIDDLRKQLASGR